MSLPSFADFFRALWGHAPYPWQLRLVEQVQATGRWPRLLDLPTGAGKTSTLDIALYLMAAEGALDPGARRAPRRVLMVVDRRSIVDQSAARARRLAERLATASDGPLLRVAQGLRQLFEGGPEEAPLTAVLLRGAMRRDEGWARRPDQPLLGLSTVDQVGSRLLFRGYGLSDSMKPVHAGLLGNDCLYLLDEVHLAGPFAQTLHALEERHIGPEARLQLCLLSATPGPGQREGFGLDEEDRQHPELRRRLQAPKPAQLLPVKVKGAEEERQEAFARRLAEEARKMARPGDTVGIVVNRVQGARRIASALLESGAEVALLTGRMRPLDRQEVERRIAPWVEPSRPQEPAPPRFLVATQCVEAGADYDLDCLITECASLDALRQRFGRLQRSGLRPQARALIALREDQQKEEDPIYGPALAATWAWLSTLEGLDMGIAAFAPALAQAPPALCAPSAQAPLLLPAALDSWAQTSPIPQADPDIALFLHGPAREEADVQLIWRADLPEQLDQREVLAGALEQLEAAPPGSLEALPIPLHQLRRWLLDEELPDTLADAEAAEPGPPPGRPRSLSVLRWRGEDSALVDLRELRPGDTVLLPSSRGGLHPRLRCLDPGSLEPVPDLGDEVQLQQRGRLCLRLHPLLQPSPPTPDPELDRAEARQEVLDWLHTQADAPALPRRWRLLEVGPPAGRSYTLLGPPSPNGLADGPDTDPETSAHTGARAVSLDAHLSGVGAQARAFARRVGLSPPLVEALARAGELHDLGKLDPRFQLWLHGGDPIAASRARLPLAKSATPREDRAARLLARHRSGYPRGARHEMLSVALIERAGLPAALEAEGLDADLVLHLVAAHHGHARPFAPAVPDPSPPQVQWQGPPSSADPQLDRLDAGLPQRFWRLLRRYGAHRLAYYEALLRLADHQQSAREQRSGSAP